MFILIVTLISAVFLYFDFYRKKNIGRTILLALIILVALYVLYRVTRVFRYGLLFALVLFPIYYLIVKGEKKS